MPNATLQAEARFWVMVCTLVALVSVYAFLQDIIAPDWPAWVLSPLIVVGFRGAVAVVPSDGVLRGVLYQVAFLAVPFMGVYGLVDAAFSADWPAWVIAPTVVAMLWMGISTLADVEAD